MPQPWAVNPANKSERGILSIIGIFVGGGCLLMAGVSVINTAFDLNLALGRSGSSTPLPNSWDAVIGLALVGVLIIALSLFGSYVAGKFSAAKGKPLTRIGIVALALLFLAVIGRGLQILALTNVYGSMLAYYATDGDLDDVRSELAKGPQPEDLDEAVHRAAQYENVDALILLLEAGADMRDASRPPEQQSCALVGTSYEFIKAAIDHGIGPENCIKGDAAVWMAIRSGTDDASAAKIIGLLLDNGWSATATPKPNEQSPLEFATDKKWSETAALLAGRMS